MTPSYPCAHTQSMAGLPRGARALLHSYLHCTSCLIATWSATPSRHGPPPPPLLIVIADKQPRPIDAPHFAQRCAHIPRGPTPPLLAAEAASPQAATPAAADAHGALAPAPAPPPCPCPYRAAWMALRQGPRTAAPRPLAGPTQLPHGDCQRGRNGRQCSRGKDIAVPMPGWLCPFPLQIMCASAPRAFAGMFMRVCVHACAHTHARTRMHTHTHAWAWCRATPVCAGRRHAHAFDAPPMGDPHPMRSSCHAPGGGGNVAAGQRGRVQGRSSCRCVVRAAQGRACELGAVPSRVCNWRRRMRAARPGLVPPFGWRCVNCMFILGAGMHVIPHGRPAAYKPSIYVGRARPGRVGRGATSAKVRTSGSGCRMHWLCSVHRPAASRRPRHTPPTERHAIGGRPSTGAPPHTSAQGRWQLGWRGAEAC